MCIRSSESLMALFKMLQVYVQTHVSRVVATDVVR